MLIVYDALECVVSGLHDETEGISLESLRYCVLTERMLTVLCDRLYRAGERVEGRIEGGDGEDLDWRRKRRIRRGDPETSP